MKRLNIHHLKSSNDKTHNQCHTLNFKSNLLEENTVAITSNAHLLTSLVGVRAMLAMYESTNSLDGLIKQIEFGNDVLSLISYLSLLVSIRYVNLLSTISFKNRKIK